MTVRGVARIAVSTQGDDMNGLGNSGPPVERGRPRCGHCGRFVRTRFDRANGIDEFGDHLDGDCPVGGYFNVNGVLRGRKDRRR